MLATIKGQRWWLMRIAALPVHLLIFTVLTFFLLRSVPGDPVLVLLGQNATPEAYDELQADLGLDGSLLDQLFRYLANVAHFDLGASLITGRPVLTELSDLVPATAELALMGLVGTLIFSVLASYVIVMHPRNAVSRGLRAYAQSAGAIPEYVLAIVALFIFYTTLHWAPPPVGRLDTTMISPDKVTGMPFLDTILQRYWDATWSMGTHLALPIITLVISQSAHRLRGGPPHGPGQRLSTGRAHRHHDVRNVIRLSTRRRGHPRDALRVLRNGPVRSRCDRVRRLRLDAGLPACCRNAVAAGLPVRRPDQHARRSTPATRRPGGGELMTATATEPNAGPAAAGPAASAPEPDQPRHRRLPSGWWMVIPPLLLILVAIVGKSLVPWDPERVAGPSSTAPNGDYWFGTDSSGLDVFSRVVAATRINLTIALLVSLLATAGGIVLGLAIGMNESRRGPLGWLARGLARVIDLVEAVPAVLIGLVVVAFYGASTTSLTLALAVILSPIQLRLTRTEVLRVRSEAYLDAARLAGLSERRLTRRHVLPNSSWAALENTSVIFAVSVILTAALGFIGVGLPPPTPEWGSMLSRGATDAIVGRWWSAAFPTLALAITVASFAGLARLLFRRGAH